MGGGVSECRDTKVELRRSFRHRPSRKKGKKYSPRREKGKTGESKRSCPQGTAEQRGRILGIAKASLFQNEARKTVSLSYSDPHGTVKKEVGSKKLKKKAVQD